MFLTSPPFCRSIAKSRKPKSSSFSWIPALHLMPALNVSSSWLPRPWLPPSLWRCPILVPRHPCCFHCSALSTMPARPLEHRPSLPLLLALEESRAVTRVCVYLLCLAGPRWHPASHTAPREFRGSLLWGAASRRARALLLLAGRPPERGLRVQLGLTSAGGARPCACA